MQGIFLLSFDTKDVGHTYVIPTIKDFDGR